MSVPELVKMSFTICLSSTDQDDEQETPLYFIVVSVSHVLEMRGY